MDFLWTKIKKVKTVPCDHDLWSWQDVKNPRTKKSLFLFVFVVVLSCFVFVLSLRRLDDGKLSLARLFIYCLRFLIRCALAWLFVTVILSREALTIWAAMFRLKKQKQKGTLKFFSFFALSHEAMVSECCPLWTCVYFLFSPPSLTSLWLHCLLLSYLFQRGIG